MQYSDLFGEGTVYNNGTLSIPKSNLEDMGLASDSQDLVSIVTAILLRVNNYFTGAIVDSDGAVLVDDNGDYLGYDQNRVEMTLNCEFIGKQYNLDGSKLYWDLLISFYEVQV